MALNIELRATETDEQAYERAKAMVEVEAKIIEILKPFTQRTRARILNFMADRLAEEAEWRRNNE